MNKRHDAHGSVYGAGCLHPRRRHLVATLVLAVVASGLATGSSASSERPDRIVAKGGSVTEILFALGQQNRIAAVDTTSLFPLQALKEKLNVGYMWALSAEGVLSMRLSLVIVLDGSGPPTAIKALSDAGVRMQSMPDIPTSAGVVTKIENVGRLAGASAEAERLAAQVGASFAELADLRASIAKKRTPRRVLFVLLLQNGRAVAGGRSISADGVIALAGGINAAAVFDGYKPMSDEAIDAAAPDITVTMRRGDAAATPEEVFSLSAFAATPAAKTRALLAMEDSISSALAHARPTPCAI